MSTTLGCGAWLLSATVCGLGVWLDAQAEHTSSIAANSFFIVPKFVFRVVLPSLEYQTSHLLFVPYVVDHFGVR